MAGDSAAASLCLEYAIVCATFYANLCQLCQNPDKAGYTKINPVQPMQTAYLQGFEEVL